MTAPVFVIGEGVLNSALPGSVVRLGGAEGRHAAGVRRLRAGERIDLVDGRGMRAVGSVASVLPAELDVLVEQVAAEPQPSVRLSVVLALIKGDRFESAVRMLTEVGVDRILPWAAHRSIVQWRGEKAERALERLRSQAWESGKQARRARFPEIGPLVGGAEVADLIAGSTAGLVLHETAGEPLHRVQVPGRGEVVLVVGPEGGIAEEELAAFTAAGARTVGMGQTVMRSGTAAVASAVAVLAAGGRWDPADDGG